MKIAVLLLIGLFLAGCTNIEEAPAPTTVVPSATPMVAPAPSPTVVPPLLWRKTVVPGTNRIDLLIADPDNNNVYALEYVAEKTILVWGSRDLGATWIKMGAVTPDLFRTRQVKPDGIKETGEQLFIWPTLPGTLPLNTKQPFATLEKGKMLFLFVAKGNEVLRATLNLP